jgi:hypothetical protein
MTITMVSPSLDYTNYISERELLQYQTYRASPVAHKTISIFDFLGKIWYSWSALKSHGQSVANVAENAGYTYLSVELSGQQ